MRLRPMGVLAKVANASAQADADALIRSAGFVDITYDE